MKYNFRITQYNSNFEYVDDWEEWTSAGSKFEAQDIMERAYPECEGYKCVFDNVID